MTIAAEWSGPVGDAWAASWTTTDRSFAALATTLDAAILSALPKGARRAVDLGCGAGKTSIALAAARPDLLVTGVDVSADLVRVATARGGSLSNLDFTVADLDHDAPLVARGADLLCSRHGVMFFADPGRIFAQLKASVAPSANLVFSCFRAPSLNPWAGALAAELTGIAPPPPRSYAPGPFAFADPNFVRSMLSAAGWRVQDPEPVDYPYVAGEGTDPVADAIAFFRRIGPVARAIADAPAEQRAALIDRLAILLEPHRRGDHISFPASAWIWRATVSENPA